MNLKGFGRKRTLPNEILSQYLRDGLTKPTETSDNKPIADASAEIVTEDLSNISLERYIKTNLFGINITMTIMIILLIIIKFLFICLLTQQPKNQLRSEHKAKKETNTYKVQNKAIYNI
jgi:hypothetical protein